MFCRKSKPVLVLVERKSRFVIIARLKSKNAEDTAHTIMNIFSQLNERLRRSITFDNGAEFARHTLLKEALNMATWFCDAYASWQKGAVENMNGRLRRDLPRKIDPDKLSDEDLQDIAWMHNLTPPQSQACSATGQLQPSCSASGLLRVMPRGLMVSPVVGNSISPQETCPHFLTRPGASDQ